MNSVSQLLLDAIVPIDKQTFARNGNEVYRNLKLRGERYEVKDEELEKGCSNDFEEELKRQIQLDLGIEFNKEAEEASEIEYFVYLLQQNLLKVKRENI